MKEQQSGISYRLNKQETIIRDVKISYSIQGSGSPIVLIHGWPQTQDSWRHVVPLLLDHHTVITVDLPGIGGSASSKSGYSKRELAFYIHDLIVQLGYGHITMVGHDIGGQVAYSYAGQFEADLQAVLVIDVPIPGLPGWEQERGKWPRWHFAFHQQPDLPEILVANNVANYLNYFFKGLSYQKQALNETEVEPYIKAYSDPATLHAGFELYRAFEQDSVENANQLLPKLSIPLLAIGGEHSRMKDAVGEQFREVVDDLNWLMAPDSGHFIPEENPVWLAKVIIKFIADR